MNFYITEYIILHFSDFHKPGIWLTYPGKTETVPAHHFDPQFLTQCLTCSRHSVKQR